MTVAVRCSACALIALAFLAIPAFAEDGPATQRSATQASATTAPAHAPKGTLTVAVLEFESHTPGSADLGKQIGEMIEVTLSGQTGFQLVDRTALSRALQEHELNLTGVVDADQAIKIGRIVGAKIIITGKAFTLDKNVMITAKLIGTETSLVDGIVIKGKQDDDLGDLVMKAAERVAARLREAGPKLVASDTAVADPLPALKAQLAGRKLPKIGVSVTEQHIGPALRASDPAVETELKSILHQAGITVVVGDDKKLAEEGVELTLSGEAFSETAGRIGNLICCTARLELSLTERKSGNSVFTDRTTTRAVDLSDQIAGKTALQKAGRVLGVHVLQHLAETLPPKGETSAPSTRPS